MSSPLRSGSKIDEISKCVDRSRSMMPNESFLLFRLKRQIVEASQSINSVVASLQAPSSSSSSSNNALLKHSLPLPSDFSSSASSSISPLSLSSKAHHRFDAASFYELATLAAAHAAAAAAFHTSKAPNSNTTYQDFANALSTQTAV